MRSANSVIRLAVTILTLLWLLASLLVHPLPHGASGRAAAALFPGAGITPPLTRVFDHACADCHSEKTRWPWYGQVAPLSWLLEVDVKRARQRLNLSRWDRLNTTEQTRLLAAIASMIQNHEMPPRRYLALHPEARMSADQSVEVIEWTRGERRRLRESAAELKGKCLTWSWVSDMRPKSPPFASRELNRYSQARVDVFILWKTGHLNDGN
jgi:Haem-binding domain